MIPMYMSWLHDLCELYGPCCLLSEKSLLNLITLSLNEMILNYHQVSNIRHFRCLHISFLYPLLQRSWKGGYTGFSLYVCPSVHLSVCLSVCGRNRNSVSSTILVGSISYLHILSSNLRRCVACNACFKINFGEFFKLVTLTLSFFLTWDPIWLNSTGNHEAVGGIIRTQAF